MKWFVIKGQGWLAARGPAYLGHVTHLIYIAGPGVTSPRPEKDTLAACGAEGLGWAWHFAKTGFISCEECAAYTAAYKLAERSQGVEP